MQALVQLRGEVDVSQDVMDTLSMLNLGRVNHATLIPETDTYRGMITKVNDVVAFGEPSAETVELLLERRGESDLEDEEIDDDWVGWNTSYDSLADLSEALVAEETTLQESDISPTLRLHPPRKGHDGIKHPIKEGGQLGEHDTEDIDALLEAMR